MTLIKHLRKPLAIALLASITNLNFYIYVVDTSNSDSRSTTIKIGVDLTRRGGLPKFK
ncbi:hypothetical protein [Nodularia sp. LEGE 04288]|uniref:hypothetical protein n=1 Tax=Nodularia sp. LEGE 04288 TaxID=1828639 RepID=UPI001D1162D3|nr:hypothetical protein [Nodularia sp. LEGE 04288]MCC2695894.1 hypothetical protein [Nodularia sp. LEGE 04288]